MPINKALRVPALVLAALVMAVSASAHIAHWTPDENIVAHIEKQRGQKTFAAALKASGLRDRLKGAGKFTVIVPPDSAFAALPPGMVRDLMKAANKRQLDKLIGCHIIPREIKLAEQDLPMTVETLGGCALRVFRDGTDLKVRDENGIVGTLLRSDVFESNGQIDEIDAVLTPSLSSLGSDKGPLTENSSTKCFSLAEAKFSRHQLSSAPMSLRTTTGRRVADGLRSAGLMSVSVRSSRSTTCPGMPELVDCCQKRTPIGGIPCRSRC